VVVRDQLGFEHEFEMERVWLLVKLLRWVRQASVNALTTNLLCLFFLRSKDGVGNRRT
jgi:hypothetical protein